MPEFTISVNISAVQLLEARFLDDFYKVIQEEGFPYENLIVELTESYAVKNMDFFWDKFRDLRSHGIRIAMDDFGTGYSSLEVLKTAPIDPGRAHSPSGRARQIPQRSQRGKP